MTRTYLAIPDAFTGEDCDRIVALGGDGKGAPGPLYGGDGRKVDRTRRDVVSHLVARGEAPWLFDRLDLLFGQAAEALALPVDPVFEPVQLLRYDEGGHFQMWHTDSGADQGTVRRISMSVELSDPGDYDAGALQIVPDLMGEGRTVPRGGAHLFPSRALHRVLPVARGTRWALVAWTGLAEG